MVHACGGIEGNQIGEDARLCMGGKVRGKCGGSLESVSSHGDIEEASHLDRLPRRSLSASETHLDSFLKVPPFLGYGLLYICSQLFGDYGYFDYFMNWLLCVAWTLSFFLVVRMVLFMKFEWFFYLSFPSKVCT